MKNSTKKDKLAEAEITPKVRKTRKKLVSPPPFIITNEQEFYDACDDCAEALIDKMKKTPQDTLIFKTFFEVPGTYGMYVHSYKIDLKNRN